MSTLLWTLIAFVSGAIPFSPLIGKIALHTDIRTYGDGNPGATNVLRAGKETGPYGALAYGAAVFLDMFKGALPIALVYYVFEMRGPDLVPIALAPLLGHLFSPFLGGRGGKGVAVTGGIWIGLTAGSATAVGIACMSLGYLVQDVAGWAVLLGMGGIGAYLLAFQRVPLLLAIWASHTVILLWRHRKDLRTAPHWRRWLTGARSDTKPT